MLGNTYGNLGNSSETLFRTLHRNRYDTQYTLVSVFFFWGGGVATVVSGQIGNTALLDDARQCGTRVDPIRGGVFVFVFLFFYFV